jgi:hypothetical protein
LDGQPVIGPGHELAVEWRTLEQARHQIEPLIAARRRKIASQRKDIGGAFGHCL